MSRFEEHATATAIVARDRATTYAELAARCEAACQELRGAGVKAGDCVGVLSNYSPGAVACLLALLRLRCVLVPLSHESRDQHAAFFRIAELDHLVTVSDDDELEVQATVHRCAHPLLEQLRAAGEPGLILFSSGSTGEPKAIVHALPRLLEKFRTPRHCYRTISFLLFDHIGGFNTLFYTLANGGCIVVPADRSVSSVCRAIEKHRVELLPTSPSFLNLLLLAEAHRSFDLSSLQLVTYGTEVMPERTLRLANQALPHARFLQTYGLSEIGILRSKSKSDDSLFVQVGGEDYETKVVDGILYVRAVTSMLGYLNAPSPFDEDGWFCTGDSVVQEGPYYRILGRQSEIINVGGQKVYPAEVEQALAGLPSVIDVAVRGEQHMLLGQQVVATIQMSDPVPAVEMKRKVMDHCRGKLQPYMIPSKVRVVTEDQVNYRFKKIRS